MSKTDVPTPQIQTGDPRTCSIFIPAWGSSWGIQVFSSDKIKKKKKKRNSSGAYIPWSEHADKYVWNAAQCSKIVDAFCLRLFLRVWLVKTRIPPNWSPIGATRLYSNVTANMRLDTLKAMSFRHDKMIWTLFFSFFFFWWDTHMPLWWDAHVDINLKLNQIQLGQDDNIQSNYSLDWGKVMW